MDEQGIIERIKEYAETRSPFSFACDEPFEFELTKTTHGRREPDLFGKWYVHVWVPRLQCAYGLFVEVWQDEKEIKIGGVLDAVGVQEVFEYYPSLSLPIVRCYPH